MEPADCVSNNRFHCAGLWKKVARTGHDLQLLRASQAIKRPLVELDDCEICSAHDQERGGANSIEDISREIWSAAAGHDGTDTGITVYSFSSVLRLSGYGAVRVSAIINVLCELATTKQ